MEVQLLKTADYGLALSILLFWCVMFACAASNYYKLCPSSDMNLGRSQPVCQQYNGSLASGGASSEEHFIAVDVFKRSPCHGRLLVWRMPISQPCLMRMIILRVRDSSEHPTYTSTPHSLATDPSNLHEYVEVSSVTGHLVPGPTGEATLSLAQEEVEIFIEPSDIFAFSSLSPQHCLCFSPSQEDGAVWTSSKHLVTSVDDTHWLKPELLSVSWGITFDTTASFSSDIQEKLRADLQSSLPATSPSLSTQSSQTASPQSESHLVEVADYGGSQPLRLLADMTLLADSQRTLPIPQAEYTDHTARTVNLNPNSNGAGDIPMTSSLPNMTSPAAPGSGSAVMAIPAVMAGIIVCVLVAMAIWKVRQPQSMQASCPSYWKHRVKRKEHVYDLPQCLSPRHQPSESICSDQISRSSPGQHLRVQFVSDEQMVKTHLYAVLEKAEIAYAVPHRKQHACANNPSLADGHGQRVFLDTGSFSSDATTPELPHRSSIFFDETMTEV